VPKNGALFCVYKERKMKKTLIIVLALLMFIVVSGGCNSSQANNLANDAALTINGDGVEIMLDAQDMRSQEIITLTCTNIDSKGVVAEVMVSGFSLSELLAANDILFENVTSMNFIGSDGYKMAAPANEFADNDVYVIFNYDGEELEYPRSCIPDKRAMYWVKNLVEIELVLSEQAGSSNTVVDQISIFREGIKELDGAELGNKGEYVLAYFMQDYFEKYIGSIPTDPLKMIAIDGFSKTETADVFFDNYVTIEEQVAEEGNLPLYFSETLSNGMRVKQLDAVISASNAIYFGNDISLDDLFDMVGMGEANSYTFIATDGYQMEIPAAAIEYGMIYEDTQDGYIAVSFDGYDFENARSDGKIKYLLTIQANNIIASSDANEQAVANTLLTCVIDDEQVNLSKKDILVLLQIEKELTRTNSKGETTTAVYEGVHWSEIAKKLDINSKTEITLIAADGYEMKLTSEMINDPDSLFALYQDGEDIKSEEDGRVWFCASEQYTANNWVKYVVKIIVE
jgi:hypothetical protein